VQTQRRKDKTDAARFLGQIFQACFFAVALLGMLGYAIKQRPEPKDPFQRDPFKYGFALPSPLHRLIHWIFL
jgi:hypothetical protein